MRFGRCTEGHDTDVCYATHNIHSCKSILKSTSASASFAFHLYFLTVQP